MPHRSETEQSSWKKRSPVKHSGFTIVELLVSIGVLAVILGITLVALNPVAQLAKSRDTKRMAAVDTLANALQQFAAENKGIYPEGITQTQQSISSAGVDVCSILIPSFLPALPRDPSINNGARISSSDCDDYDTGYTVSYNASGNLIVEAPLAESGEEIKKIR